jgi:hypothetical protein
LDQFFAGGPRKEGHDDVGVGDIRKLDALFRETPDIVTERLVWLLFTTPEIPRVAWAHVGPLEVPFEHSRKVVPVVDPPRRGSSSHARAVFDRNRGSYRMMTRSSMLPPN